MIVESVTKKPWEAWFAWFPVKARSNGSKKWVWFNSVLRQETMTVSRREEWVSYPWLEEWKFEYKVHA